MLDVCSAAQLEYNVVIRSTNASVAEQFVSDVEIVSYRRNDMYLTSLIMTVTIATYQVFQ